MAKSKPTFTTQSYGIYDGWKGSGKTLPKSKQSTLLIPAEVDIEFGLIVRAQKAKGLILHWRIEHPDITDEKGMPMAPFEGEVQVRNNDWQFYLGDTIWAPEFDKLGLWSMTIMYDGVNVASKTFEITNEINTQQEANFWKKRGF
ncbi:MAG: hypothetical protein ACJAVV_000478 [Alphaproteobacteria bacterium]|jgi:hypothetical protein